MKSNPMRGPLDGQRAHPVDGSRRGDRPLRVAVLVPEVLPRWLKNSDLHQNRAFLELGAWADVTMVPMPNNELAWSAVAPLALMRAAHRVGAMGVWRATETVAYVTRPIAADVILTHWLWPEYAPWVRQRLPVVWGPGYDPIDLPWRAFKKRDPRFLRRVAECGVMFMANQASADALVEDVPSVRDKAAVIPIFEPHLPRAALPMRPQAAGLRVLFVGREARRKNLMAVVAAVDALRAEGRTVALTVVSDFRDGPTPVPAYATLIPELSQVEVFAAMQTHDVLCMPSFFETYGMVFIEAMAAGIAVVARDAPIQRAMLGDGARYADPHDVAGLIATLRELSDPDIRGTQIAHGSARYGDRYAPSVVAKAFVDAARRAIALKG